MSFAKDGTIAKFSSTRSQNPPGGSSRTTSASAHTENTRTFSEITTQNGKLNFTQTSQTVIQSQAARQTERVWVEQIHSSKDIEDFIRKAGGSAGHLFNINSPQLRELKIEETSVTQQQGRKNSSHSEEHNVRLDQSQAPKSSWSFFKKSKDKANDTPQPQQPPKATQAKQPSSGTDARPFNSSQVYTSPFTKRTIPTGNRSSVETPRAVPVPSTANNKKLGPGEAYIFNQIKFTTGEKERKGSLQDVKALSRVFEFFQLKTKVHTDLTIAQIQSTMKDIGKRNFSKASCVVIVILSHGNRSDYICAKDGPYQIDATILEPLLGIPSLKNKPKIFFIQACKGNNAIEADRTTTSPPIEVLKCYSTFEGYLSYRDSESGSYFIQTLCEQLQARGHSHDVRAIMDKVINLVRTKTRENNIEQIPSVLSTLTQLYVFGDYMK